MKTIYLFLILFVISFNVLSQEGKITLGLGTGVGIYGGSTNENGKKDTSAVDAACALISVLGEYTFVERLSGGFLIERNGFLTNTDSSEKATSLNVFATEKFRFVDNENNKIFVGLAEGYSYLSFATHDGHAYGNGYCFQAGAGWEHFFTENIGMSLSAWYVWYQYSNIYDAFNNPVMVNNGTDDFTLTFSGANIKAGLVVKF